LIEDCRGAERSSQGSPGSLDSALSERTTRQQSDSGHLEQRQPPATRTRSAASGPEDGLNARCGTFPNRADHAACPTETPAVRSGRLDAWSPQISAAWPISAGGIGTSRTATAERLFGLTKEALGQNVSILMPEPYRLEHDSYLARYLAPGIQIITGSPAHIGCPDV
jgi:hypothetical protein